jgi:hypothetical protein
MKMRKPVQVQDEDKEEDEEQEKDNEAFACYGGGTLSSVGRCSFEYPIAYNPSHYRLRPRISVCYPQRAATVEVGEPFP